MRTLRNYFWVKMKAGFVQLYFLTEVTRRFPLSVNSGNENIHIDSYLLWVLLENENSFRKMYSLLILTVKTIMLWEHLKERVCLLSKTPNRRVHPVSQGSQENQKDQLHWTLRCTVSSMFTKKQQLWLSKSLMHSTNEWIKMSERIKQFWEAE